ncbi:MAG: hypothetical protein J6S99_04115 [Bacteroidales bacterium]|nr:hypothetical protein [Bacteroidales bacterium]
MFVNDGIVNVVALAVGVRLASRQAGADIQRGVAVEIFDRDAHNEVEENFAIGAFQEAFGIVFTEFCKTADRLVIQFFGFLGGIAFGIVRPADIARGAFAHGENARAIREIDGRFDAIDIRTSEAGTGGTVKGFRNVIAAIDDAVGSLMRCVHFFLKFRTFVTSIVAGRTIAETRFADDLIFFRFVHKLIGLEVFA